MPSLQFCNNLGVLIFPLSPGRQNHGAWRQLRGIADDGFRPSGRHGDIESAPAERAKDLGQPRTEIRRPRSLPSIQLASHELRVNHTIRASIFIEEDKSNFGPKRQRVSRQLHLDALQLGAAPRGSSSPLPRSGRGGKRAARAGSSTIAKLPTSRARSRSTASRLRPGRTFHRPGDPIAQACRRLAPRPPSARIPHVDGRDPARCELGERIARPHR